jgi:hypothetical protein
MIGPPGMEWPSVSPDGRTIVATAGACLFDRCSEGSALYREGARSGLTYRLEGLSPPVAAGRTVQQPVHLRQLQQFTR